MNDYQLSEATKKAARWFGQHCKDITFIVAVAFFGATWQQVMGVVIAAALIQFFGFFVAAVVMSVLED